MVSHIKQGHNTIYLLQPLLNCNKIFSTTKLLGLVHAEQIEDGVWCSWVLANIVVINAEVIYTKPWVYAGNICANSLAWARAPPYSLNIYLNISDILSSQTCLGNWVYYPLSLALLWVLSLSIYGISSCSLYFSWKTHNYESL